MIRHAGRALALFAVGALFAGGAWAQPPTMAQTVTDRYLVAEELLGSADGTVVELSNGVNPGVAGTTAVRPAVRLAVPAGGIAAENTAEITFVLNGATFAQTVGASTIDFRDDATAGAASTSARVSAERISGGGQGDSSVTFLVEAETALTAAGLVSFWLPDLRVSPTVVGHTATVPPMPVLGVGVVASVVEKRAVTNGAAGPFRAVSGAVDTPMTNAAAAMNNHMNRLVLSPVDVVNISLGMGPNVAEVALANRKMFATANSSYTPMGSNASVRALRVGTLTVTVNGGGTPADSTDRIAGQVYTLNPTRTAVDYDDTAVTTDDELHSSLAGNVDVVVKGVFKTGDMVVYGSPRKPAKIADGMAEVSVPISLAGGSTDLIYVPGGVDDLRPGNIAAVAMLNFSAAGNNPGKPVMSAGVISYAGVDVHAYAQGVVRGNGMDSSYVRVRCASATDCTVFLDCHDQDGMNYFGEAGTIDAGATTVWSSDDVAGVFEAGWSSGRGACDILSNGDLNVQHMVRSHDTLINNSAVVGRSLVEDRIDSIDKVLGDICSSVTGHTGRDQTPAAALVTEANPITVHAIAATMCKNINAVDVPDTVDTTPDDASST